MNRFWLKLLLTCSISLSVTQAYAQLYKCVGPNGEITFTKHGCNTASQTQKIEVGTVNSQDSSAARRNINEYQQKRSMQRQAPRVTVVGDTSEAERRQRELCRAATTPHKGAQNRQLTAAQRATAAAACGGRSGISNYDYSGDTGGYGASPAPSHMTNCDGAGCWDNQGNRYNKGAGSTYFRNDGRVCQHVGGMMQCN